MQKNINFLKDRLLAFKRKNKKQFLIKTWSLTILAIYSVLVIIIFVFQITSKRKNQFLQEKILQTENTITALQAIETKQVYLMTKTKSLQTILASKREHQEIVDSLFTFLIEGVTIANFNILTEGWVSFDVSCNTFENFKKFLNQLTEGNDKLKLEVNEVSIGGISYGLQRPYQFNVKLKFFQNIEKND